MMGIFRRTPPAPQSDLQNRLRVIHDRAEEILKRRTGSDRCPADGDDVAVLAYLVSYLATITEKHLREKES